MGQVAILVAFQDVNQALDAAVGHAFAGLGRKTSDAAAAREVAKQADALLERRIAPRRIRWQRLSFKSVERGTRSYGSLEPLGSRLLVDHGCYAVLFRASRPPCEGSPRGPRVEVLSSSSILLGIAPERAFGTDSLAWSAGQRRSIGGLFAVPASVLRSLLCIAAGELGMADRRARLPDTHCVGRKGVRGGA